jgi:hypothetical protein
MNKRRLTEELEELSFEMVSNISSIASAEDSTDAMITDLTNKFFRDTY